MIRGVRSSNTSSTGVADGAGVSVAGGLAVAVEVGGITSGSLTRTTLSAGSRSVAGTESSSNAKSGAIMPSPSGRSGPDESVLSGGRTNHRSTATIATADATPATIGVSARRFRLRERRRFIAGSGSELGEYSRHTACRFLKCTTNHDSCHFARTCPDSSWQHNWFVLFTTH
jgi:hypothetical protein